jgi:hypothetical protein
MGTRPEFLLVVESLGISPEVPDLAAIWFATVSTASLHFKGGFHLPRRIAETGWMR